MARYERNLKLPGIIEPCSWPGMRGSEVAKYYGNLKLARYERNLKSARYEPV